VLSTMPVDTCAEVSRVWDKTQCLPFSTLRAHGRQDALRGEEQTALDGHYGDIKEMEVAYRSILNLAGQQYVAEG
jgi:hypothetical protein